MYVMLIIILFCLIIIAFKEDLDLLVLYLNENHVSQYVYLMIMVLFIIVHRCSSTRKYIIVEKGHDFGIHCFSHFVTYSQTSFSSAFAAGHAVRCCCHV